MKIGIYIWHAKNENRYCIGEWDPSKKQYANMSDKEAALFRISQEIKSKDGTSKYQISDIVLDYYCVLSFYNPDNRTSHFDKIVHANLVKRMIQKLDLKKGDTVCDWCCKGVGLLKNIPAGHKLYARVEDKRTELIVKKLLPNVNIVKDMTMNFDHIIMNPPYDKNLHLKILSEAMKHSDDVVNLSPIRWLQDPLAEYKKGSDWKKFENIRKRIETLDVVPMEDACYKFGVPFMMDLGIYHITSKGGFDTSCFENSVIYKVEEKLTQTLSNVAEENKIDGWRCRIQKVSPVPSNRMNSSSGQARQNTLCHHSLDWVYKDGKTKDGKLWNRNVLPGAGKTFDDGENLPVSIKFDTETEAYNFQSYTKTKFFKYIYSKMKTDQNVPLKYLPFMPTYEHPWTDEMLYEYFGLTEDEIKEIEQEIK